MPRKTHLVGIRTDVTMLVKRHLSHAPGHMLSRPTAAFISEFTDEGSLYCCTTCSFTHICQVVILLFLSYFVVALTGSVSGKIYGVPF